MKVKSIIFVSLLTLALCLITGGALLAETWQNAALLNSPSETSVKNAHVFGSINGGFHLTYGTSSTKYRRYQNNSLGSIVTVNTVGQAFNPRVSEARNGNVHVVWEGWDWSGIPVGWARSTNGGASFSVSTVANNNTKFPYISPYGTGTNEDMILTAGRINHPNNGNNNLYWNRYTGSWGTTSLMNAVNSEYSLEGITRSPSTGYVWKIYQGSDNKAYIRSFNGSSWGTAICIDSTAVFRARFDIAANAAGDLLCLWSRDDRTRVKSYSPSSGQLGSEIIFAYQEDFGKVTGITGTNDFYVVYTASDRSTIKGRRYTGGSFQTPVTVHSGLPTGFYVDPQVSSDNSGNLCCAFEYWGSGNPQQYYAICTSYQVVNRIVGTVTSGGSAVSGATVSTTAGGYATTTNASGAYTLNVAPSTYTVVAYKNGTYYREYATGVTVGQGQTVTRNFTLTTRGRLTKNDFSDRDARSDLALYRPASSSTWVIRKSSGSFSTEESYQWGSSTYNDIAVSGDWDGDGKTDLGVFRPGSSAWWYIRMSHTGYTVNWNYQCGTTNDQPLAGDYDGDGITDIAVFRPGSQAYFIVWKSSLNFASSESTAWGTTGDVPLTGDWDGDGKADFAVWRSGSTAAFFVKKSSDGGTISQNWGITGDTPLSGNFDSDNKTDFVVYRPGSQSVFWVKQSSNGGNVSYNWGTTGDIPQSGDYDGDGKTEITVYRPGSSASWWIKTSTSGYANYWNYNFGISGDTLAGPAGQQPFSH